MNKYKIVKFINKSQLVTFKEMEELIVEYYFFYSAELDKSGYTNADILNDKNGAMTAMNIVINKILREIYGDELTEEFFDYQIENSEMA